MSIHTLRLGFLTAVMALFALPLAAGTLVEKSDQTYPIRGEVFKLENVNGSIDVLVWNRPEVRVEAEKRVEGGSRDAVESAMAKLRIEVTNTPDGLQVVTRYPNHGDDVFSWLAGTKVNASVRYRLTVPRDVRVEIESVNAGITADGVLGGHSLRTVNGRILVRDGGGAFEASTVNGSIEAQLGLPGDRMRVKTVNGAVELALPSDVRASVEVATVNGSIRSELPLIAQEAGRRKLRGTINGGGAPIEIKTVNGSVTIASN